MSLIWVVVKDERRPFQKFGFMPYAWEVIEGLEAKQWYYQSCISESSLASEWRKKVK